MCCNDCKAKKPVGPGRSAGLWSGLLLLLVPKCPFCFMAFSSVMVLCGENGGVHSSRTFYSATTLLLTAIFCLTALLSILIYYRQGTGKYALLMAIPGMIMLFCSVTLGGGTIVYYTGAFMVLAGLLRNSGFWSYWERMMFTKKDALPSW